MKTQSETIKPLIAMSGGVDSSVAAFLASEQSAQAIGCIMRLYENDIIGEDLFGTCCSLTDMQDARAVADLIGIPFHVFHYEHEFRDKVIGPFVDSYLNGETPNPCLNCNRYLKFDHLYEKASELGCTHIATGHYAGIRYNKESGRYELLRAKDDAKDQSYVLYMLMQEQLSRTLFPLGSYTKEEVRAIAAENGFITAEKKESQDICFVPDGHYPAFIERYTGRSFEEGNFVDEDGTILGRHKGIARYTVGQRRGLGLASTASWYVKSIRPKDNEVVLTRADGVFTDRVIVRDVNWVSIAPPADGETVSCTAMVRYRGKESACTVRILNQTEESSASLAEVTFLNPIRAATPGQALVLYDGDRVLGGGIICG